MIYVFLFKILLLSFANMDLLFYDGVEIGIYARVFLVIPKRETADLVIVVPEAVKLIDVFTTCLILLDTRIVEVEGGNLTDKECLHIGGITLLRYLVSPTCRL